MDEAVKLGLALVRLASDLFDGTETPAGARVRVRDLLPEQSDSEKAAEDIIRAKRLERLDELDDVDSLHEDEDEVTKPGAR